MLTNFELISAFLGEELKNVNYKTDKTVILEYSRLYFLKESQVRLDYLYKMLDEQRCSYVIYPVKTFVIEGYFYYLFYYDIDNSLPSKRKIYDLKDALMNLHNQTSVQKELKKNNYKFLYRLYRRLDLKFRMLESLIVEVENHDVHNDNDWIILSKYSLFLDVKKELYNLQTSIHKSIDEKKKVYYAILHGFPSLSHLVNGKLVSFDNARFGFIVSDIAKMYCLNDDVKIDLSGLFNDWISSYNDSFYNVYFKFMVLYLFMDSLYINLTIDNLFINNYVEVHKKLGRAMTFFNNEKEKNNT